MIGQIHARFDREMQRSLDDSLCFPVAPVLVQADVPILAQLLEVLLDRRYLPQREIPINHARIAGPGFDVRGRAIV